jgi:hypothetical protein
MKKFLIISMCLLSLFSYAAEEVKTKSRRPQQVGGDIGMKYILAENLTFKRSDIGTEISFTGAEALNLFNALPQLEPSDYPGKETGFIAQGQRKAVYFKCTRINSASDDSPICAIKITKAFDMKKDFRSKWISK